MYFVLMVIGGFQIAVFLNCRFDVRVNCRFMGTNRPETHILDTKICRSDPNYQEPTENVTFTRTLIRNTWTQPDTIKNQKIGY